MSKSKKLTSQEKNRLNMEQFHKSSRLEQLLVNNSTEEIKEYLEQSGGIDFTARVLGIACRYYGLEHVKTLVESGAKFEFKWNPEVSANYQCYTYPTMVMIVPSDFMIMLLGDVCEALTGFYKTAGTFLKNPLSFTDGKSKEMLPFSERLEIVKYLDQNAKKAKFDKNALYYYSILADDSEMRTALKEMGAVLPENVKAALTSGDSKGVWQRFCETADKMTDEQFINAVNNLSEELECVLNFSAYFQGHVQSKLKSTETFKVVLEKFDTSKINHSLVMKCLIDVDNVSGLAVAVGCGWLNTPRKRDEMIDYAVNNKKTECTAYLLDFKNRTADLAAEREKAEKREERELNAAPDSVTALKKIWSYKKLEDGTLIITGYKGTSQTPTVPERIGKSTVTAIGEYAFSPMAFRINSETARTRRSITSVTFPEGIKFIDEGVFFGCENLCKITLPRSLNDIGFVVYYNTQAEFYVPRGSFAEEFCKSKGYKYTVTE